MLPDLTTALARAEFESAIAVAAGVAESDPVRRAARVRTLLDPDNTSGLATAALTQAELRSRARAKFGDSAGRLYLTAAGLEQATRPELADHRAARFRAAGAGEVLDLGCGIGADLLAFARAGITVLGVELDPETAAIATANLAQLDPAAGRVEIGDVLAYDWAAAESVFLDPARRSSSGRILDPAAFSPPLDFVLSVVGRHRLAAAKLAPGLDHSLVPPGVEAEWVSYAGGVKEAVLWSSGFSPGADAGDRDGPVRRRASVLPAGVQLTDRDPAEGAVRRIGAFIHEPDGAVIRAGLVQQAAAAAGATLVDEHLAYLSGDTPAAGPLLRSYRVLDVLDYSVKRLRSALRTREVGIVEIKKRGVDIDPAALRRELSPRGPNSLTVLLARVGDRRLAVLAEPVQPDRPAPGPAQAIVPVVPGTSG